MPPRVAHFSLDTINTLVIPTPGELHLRIPLPDFIDTPVEYEFTIGGKHHTGVLDDRGEAHVPVAYEAGDAEFKLWLQPQDPEPLHWALELYSVIPGIETVRGFQLRLSNLGINPGPVDNIMGQQTRSAIRYFQRQQSLPVTGEADAATESALVKAYGC